VFQALLGVLKKFNIDTANLIKINNWYMSNSAVFKRKCEALAVWYMAWESRQASKKLITIDELFGNWYLLTPIIKFSLAVLICAL
jgi:hypothetical protein